MCDKTNHNLTEVYSAGTSDPGVSIVVRWCKDCGAVVVDADVDGRTYPGKFMPMRFPKEINRR